MTLNFLFPASALFLSKKLSIPPPTVMTVFKLSRDPGLSANDPLAADDAG